MPSAEQLLCAHKLLWTHRHGRSSSRLVPCRVPLHASTDGHRCCWETHPSVHQPLHTVQQFSSLYMIFSQSVSVLRGCNYVSCWNRKELAFTRPKAGRPTPLGAFSTSVLAPSAFASVAFEMVPHWRLRATPPGQRVIGSCEACRRARKAIARSSVHGPCGLSQSGPFCTVFPIFTH